MVLLKVACTCATPSGTERRARRARRGAGAAAAPGAAAVPGAAPAPAAAAAGAPPPAPCARSARGALAGASALGASLVSFSSAINLLKPAVMRRALAAALLPRQRL